MGKLFLSTFSAGNIASRDLFAEIFSEFMFAIGRSHDFFSPYLFSSSIFVPCDSFFLCVKPYTFAKCLPAFVYSAMKQRGPNFPWRLFGIFQVGSHDKPSFSDFPPGIFLAFQVLNMSFLSVSFRRVSSRQNMLRLYGLQATGLSLITLFTLDYYFHSKARHSG